MAVPFLTVSSPAVPFLTVQFLTKLSPAVPFLAVPFLTEPFLAEPLCRAGQLKKNSNEDDFLPDVIAVQKFPLSLCLMI